MNTIWGELKFTIMYSQQQVSFLDTQVLETRDEKLDMDKYRNMTDRNSILHFNSGHPHSVKRVIPKSQFQRVNRIVSDTETHEIMLREMEEKFTNTVYPLRPLQDVRREASISGERRRWEMGKRIPSFEYKGRLDCEEALVFLLS